MVFKKLKKHKRIMTFLLASIFILLLSGIALAGYIKSALLKSYAVTATEDFYFASDLLREGPAVPAYDLYHDWQAEATAAIQVKLKNYENALNTASGDIVYTAGASASGSSASGIIPAGGTGGHEVTVRLTVPRPADPSAPLEVLVTAAAASPYTKTLQGRFIIHPALSYAVDENAGAPVAVLTVTLAPGAEPVKNVIISWPAGAAPDMTNPIVTGASSLDLTNRTLTAALNTASVCQLTFFKDSVSDNYHDVTVSGA